MYKKVSSLDLTWKVDRALQIAASAEMTKQMKCTHNIAGHEMQRVVSPPFFKIEFYTSFF